jgi:hypothetical protein
MDSRLTQRPRNEGMETMRLGLASIYVEDQAEPFSTQALGFQVHTSAPYGPGERWLSLVSPEEPDGVERVLHLADAPARRRQAVAERRTPKPGPVGGGVTVHRTDTATAAGTLPRALRTRTPNREGATMPRLGDRS